MNSLKEPSACTSTRWPFTVTVAPGSVRPLICRMFARTSMVSMVSGGGGPSPCAAPVGPRHREAREVRELARDAVLVHRRHPPVVLAGVQPAHLDRALLDAAAVHQRPVEVRAVVEQHLVGGRLRHRLPGQQRDGAGGVGIRDLGLVGGRQQHGHARAASPPARPCPTGRS